MKFDTLYFDFDKTEFINKMETKWSELLDGMYIFVCGDLKTGQTRELEVMLGELIEQRNKINDTISELNALLEYFKYDKECKEKKAEINDPASVYIGLIDETFNRVGREIFSFVYNMDFALKERKIDISSEDISALISYKISRSIKENCDRRIKENWSELRTDDSERFTLILDSNKIYKNIFYSNLLNEYDELYDTALNENRMDLSLLISREIKERDGEYSSRLQSQLFRSILSRYIFTWRNQNNVTQNELSKRSGVDRTMIAKIEKLQQTASLDTTIKILNAINAKLIIVPEGEGSKNNETL